MGVAAPPKRGTHPPPFSVHVCCGQTAGWMNTPLGMEALDGVPALRERGTAAPPLLVGPCLLWLRSSISATAELLSDMLPCISPIIRPITF